jgi:hypothetical protein
MLLTWYPFTLITLEHHSLLHLCILSQRCTGVQYLHSAEHWCTGVQYLHSAVHCRITKPTHGPCFTCIFLPMISTICTNGGCDQFRQDHHHLPAAAYVYRFGLRMHWAPCHVRSWAEDVQLLEPLLLRHTEFPLPCIQIFHKNSVWIHVWFLPAM